MATCVKAMATCEKGIRMAFCIGLGILSFNKQSTIYLRRLTALMNGRTWQIQLYVL